MLKTSQLIKWVLHLSTLKYRFFPLWSQAITSHPHEGADEDNHKQFTSPLNRILEKQGFEKCLSRGFRPAGSLPSYTVFILWSSRVWCLDEGEVATYFEDPFCSVWSWDNMSNVGKRKKSRKENTETWKWQHTAALEKCVPHSQQLGDAGLLGNKGRCQETAAAVPGSQDVN